VIFARAAVEKVSRNRDVVVETIGPETSPIGIWWSAILSLPRIRNLKFKLLNSVYSVVPDTVHRGLPQD
jgi:hypothetical protein